MKYTFMFINELDIEILRQLSYAKLIKYIDDLKNLICEIEEIKKKAVMCGKDKKAVELQRYSHNAQYNKRLMEEVIIEKEEALAIKETHIKTFFLN